MSSYGKARHPKMVRYQPVRRRLALHRSRHHFDQSGPGASCSGSGPAYSRYFKQIAKAVVLHRP
jgi:hypothetical protein